MSQSPNLAERNRIALEQGGLNAALYVEFHNGNLEVVKHYKGRLYYRPRYVHKAGVGEEYVMILYQSGNGAEYVREATSFFGYAEVNGKRVPRFVVFEPTIH